VPNEVLKFWKAQKFNITVLKDGEALQQAIDQAKVDMAAAA